MKFEKNKVIISSLIGLTALTVCGVGFSAWVIGLNQPTVTLEEMGVEIDTVTENTQYLNIVAAADEKIVIANPFVEDGTGDTVGEGIGTDGSKTCDLDIVLTSYDFAFADDATFNSLTFTPTVNTQAIFQLRNFVLKLYIPLQVRHKRPSSCYRLLQLPNT